MLASKRNAITQGSKRIAIPGRFSSRTLARDVLLGKSPGAAGALTVRNFFKHLVPDLWYAPNKVIKIGAVSFVAHDLLDPAQAGAVGKSLPVTEDSILLDDRPLDDPAAPAWHHQVQLKGGRLVADLVTDLDVLARFRNPNFTAALDALGRNYLLRAANARLLACRSAAFVSDDRWPALYESHLEVRTAVRGYLTGYDGDAEGWLERFRRAVTARAGEAELDGGRIDALAEALSALRGTLSGGPVGSDPYADPVFSDLGRAGNLPWLFDYPADPAVYVTGATVDEEGGAVPATGKRPFAAFYRQYRTHSDNVHRFVRGIALHSFPITWLASLYRPHAAVDQNETADEMARLGVFAQAERVPGESFEGRQRNRAVVRDVFARQTTIPVELNDDYYTRFRELVEQSVLAPLEPDGAFTAAALRKWLQGLFSELYLCGGEAGELLAGSDEFARGYRRLYRRVLLLAGGPGAPLTADRVREALLAECAGDEQRDFVVRVLGRVDPAADPLKGAVKDAFVATLAEDSLARFDAGYLQVGNAIRQKGDLARQLYGDWLNVVVAARGEEPGCPNLVEGAGDAFAAMQRAVAERYVRADGGTLAADQQRALRALVFGEHLAATPEGECSLGEADLSQSLAVLKDVIRHVGDHPGHNPKLYAGAGLTPGTPEHDRLRKINLSGSYPIPDASPAEMRVVLSYHYHLAQRLQQVRPHLDAVALMKRFVAGVAHTDLEVVFTNDTLAGSSARQKTTGNLFFSRYMPPVVYLLRQAFSSPPAAPGELAAFVARLLAAVGDEDMRLPVFVSEIAAGGGVPAPVIDPDTVALPRFRGGTPGENADDGRVVVTAAVQERPYLLLAASLLVPDADFGAVAAGTQQRRGERDRTDVYWDVTDDLKKGWRAALNGVLRNGAPVARLLHGAWCQFASPSATNPLFEALAFTSLVNLAAAEAGPTRRDLRRHFWAALKAAQRDRAGVEALCAGMGPEVRAALEHTLNREVLLHHSESWAEAPANLPMPIDTPARLQLLPQREADAGPVRERILPPLDLRPPCAGALQAALPGPD